MMVCPKCGGTMKKEEISWDQFNTCLTCENCGYWEVEHNLYRKDGKSENTRES